MVSLGHIGNYFYEFAVISSTLNICEQALSCLILPKKTSLILDLLLEKHSSASLGLDWFVCAGLATAVLSPKALSSHGLCHPLQCSAVIHCGTGQTPPALLRSQPHSQAPATTAFLAVHPTKAFLSLSCSTAKQHSAQAPSLSIES